MTKDAIIITQGPGPVTEPCLEFTFPYGGHFHNHGPPQTRRAYITDTMRERWFATRRLYAVNGSLVSNDSYAKSVQAAIKDWNDR